MGCASRRRFGICGGRQGPGFSSAPLTAAQRLGHFFFFPLDFGVSPCLFFLNDALPGPTRSPGAAGPLRDRAGSSRPGLDGPVSLCPDQASARGPAHS